jgi:hypothetical protein
MLYHWTVAIGICFILKYGSILESFRKFTISLLPFLEKLYKCCLCMGFWVGLFIMFTSAELWDIEYMLFPFSCSAICWIADVLVTLMITMNHEFEKED